MGTEPVELQFRHWPPTSLLPLRIDKATIKLLGRRAAGLLHLRIHPLQYP
jgi:hypothetical protein